MASKDMALMIGVGAPKDEESAAPEPSLDKETSPRAAAGKAFLSAIESGDGEALAAAFEELLTQIDGPDGEASPMGSEMMDSEPSPF